MRCLIHSAQPKVGREKESNAGMMGGKLYLLCASEHILKAISFSHHSCMVSLVLWPHFTDEDAGAPRS